MSVLIITQSPNLRVELPAINGFSIQIVRMGSNRTAVAGNVIRQYSTLHISSAEASYQFKIDKAKADILEEMHVASPTVNIHWRGKSYSASMVYRSGNWHGRKIEVDIRFGLVREL